MYSQNAPTFRLKSRKSFLKMIKELPDKLLQSKLDEMETSEKLLSVYNLD
jgi:hypothetical protein